MKHSLETKQQAKKLRKKGFSYTEIVNKVGVSKSTVCYWVKDITLTKEATVRIRKKQALGRAKGTFKSIEKKLHSKKKASRKSKKILKTINFSKNILKLLCAFLYWGEGNKSGGYVAFINSDPKMIHIFLTLLRSSYQLDESKFRVLVHLHEYHDENEVLQFWSELTQIPRSQFSKSYLKPHTGIRKRKGYKGSARIRYYDVEVVRELKALYNEFSKLTFDEGV